ncbi:hypothetical protein ABZ901_28855 [Actinacidiphila alni]|uniref:Uncharacterized protein n=1 Tax=Actinacidiphila alni TaxID=380248 RepID=A0A1I2HAH3_9ACTN|nr:hypothetical protein [Actinacidiphila alni]SFF27215.1 hypothetical protein SAMN05216251_110238 [Actinacidiphila alni]
MLRLTRACATGLTALTLLTAAPVAQAAAAGSVTMAPAAARPSLTAKASVGSIKAWQQFRVYGSTKNIKAGTRVTLQQLQKKRWVSLPASMNTNRNATYNLRVKLGIKGVNQLRIVGGGATSNVVKVTVR